MLTLLNSLDEPTGPEAVIEREQRRQARELRRKGDRLRLELALGYDPDHGGPTTDIPWGIPGPTDPKDRAIGSVVPIDDDPVRAWSHGSGQQKASAPRAQHPKGRGGSVSRPTSPNHRRVGPRGETIVAARAQRRWRHARLAEGLGRVARAPADTGWAAQGRVRAVSALIAMGEASPVPVGELRGLLEEVAFEPREGARGMSRLWLRRRLWRSWSGAGRGGGLGEAAVRRPTGRRAGGR